MNEFYQYDWKQHKNLFIDWHPTFLVFAAFSWKVPRWITQCRLNNIKDTIALEIKPMFVDAKKKDVASFGSRTYFVGILKEDGWQIEKDKLDEVYSSLRFWKLEILSGSYSPPFCLRTSLTNLPRSLSRAAAGMFITLKIFIDLLFAKPFKLFPIVFFPFHSVWAPFGGDEII